MSKVNTAQEDQDVKQEKKPKTKLMGCLTFIVIALVLGLILSSSDEGDTQSIETWAAVANITESSVKAALLGSAPVNPVNKDTGFPDGINKVEVGGHAAGGKYVNVFFKAGTFWDDTDFVKRAGGTAIVIGSILFANPEVQQVAIFDQTEMTDAYGNSSLETGAKIVISKETASKLDWGGLADRHVGDPANIYNIADDYSIHPGIYKNVKLDEVKLR